MQSKYYECGPVMLHAYIPDKYKTDQVPLIALHGFTGSGRDFLFLESQIHNPLYCPDITGHGRSCSPSGVHDYTAEAMCEQLYELIRYTGHSMIFLLGYSMGGRLALSFALKHRNMIQGLILESAAPGLIGPAEREQRKASDENLAGFIESSSPETFADYWMNIPLFSSQKDKLGKDTLDEIRAAKLKNSRKGLANSLRGFSTGVMPPLWDKLHLIDFPLLMITGALDKKFTNTAAEMMPYPGPRSLTSHIIFDGCGHNVHLEDTPGFCSIVNKFLAGHG